MWPADFAREQPGPTLLAGRSGVAGVPRAGRLRIGQLHGRGQGPGFPPGHDGFRGGNGNDTIRGGKGSDSMAGGNGNDELYGKAGDDLHYGENGNDEIYVMNARGEDLRKLSDHPAIYGVPHWSPDGQHIMFQSSHEGNHEIFVMDADGGNARNLSNHPAGDFSPRWSPGPGPSAASCM